MDYADIFRRVIADPRYLRNLEWGEPRPGHPEGTIRAHIEELERNLQQFQSRFSDTDVWKLKLLIHTHDTFKPDAKPEVAIADPHSHASLARLFLNEFCDDADLLAMLQFHDEPFALWRQQRTKGTCNPQRFAALLSAIHDWNLFLAFNIIDGCTEGKGREQLVWFFHEVAGKVQSTISERDIISI